MAKKGLLYTHCSWAVVSQTGITLCTSLLCGTFQNKLCHRYDDIVDDWLWIQVTATGGNKEKTLEAGIWKNINKRNGERHAQVCPFLTSAKRHRDRRCFTLEFRPAHNPVTSWPLLNVADFIDVKSKSLIGGRESAAETEKWTSACWGDVWVFKYTCCNDLTPHFVSNGWSRVKAERISS